MHKCCSQLTHNAKMFHISCSFHLLGELVVGELAVDHLLVTGAYVPTLLVQEDGSRTAEGERLYYMSSREMYVDENSTIDKKISNINISDSI